MRTTWAFGVAVLAVGCGLPRSVAAAEPQLKLEVIAPSKPVAAGGEITLANRVGGGLDATIRLQRR